MLTLFFAVISLLYATVGQAGGTAFLALMAFASFPSNEMRPTALLLNIVAATYSTWLFNRGSHIDWTRLKPLLIASLPTALLGGFVVMAESLYNAVTGIVLLAAAAILVVGRAKDATPDRATPPLWGAISTGAGVGFVSGLTGVGGGVFLAPILIAMHWGSPKQTAALSAPFILANSAIGLVGALLRRAVTINPNVAIRLRCVRRCHDRDYGWSPMALANDNTLCSRRCPWVRRCSTPSLHCQINLICSRQIR